ncbi:DsbE family thiol:disulfide interchange protein [Magnetococcales bacterium HHB-1]
MSAKLWWYGLLPLLILGMLALFALGLNNDPRDIPSPLVNKPAPDMEAETLFDQQKIRLKDYRGKWVLVNFWGSWCVSCIAEHPYLIELAKKVKERDDFVILGVDFKDERASAQRFLRRHGNPGYRHLFDPRQEIAIDWGVYGAPESFLITPEGMIHQKHTGPLYFGWFEKKVRPLLEKREKP